MAMKIPQIDYYKAIVAVRVVRVKERKSKEEREENEEKGKKKTNKADRERKEKETRKWKLKCALPGGRMVTKGACPILARYCTDAVILANCKKHHYTSIHITQH